MSGNVSEHRTNLSLTFSAKCSNNPVEKCKLFERLFELFAEFDDCNEQHWRTVRVPKIYPVTMEDGSLGIHVIACFIRNKAFSITTEQRKLGVRECTNCGLPT